MLYDSIFFDKNHGEKLPCLSIFLTDFYEKFIVNLTKILYAKNIKFC